MQLKEVKEYLESFDERLNQRLSFYLDPNVIKVEPRLIAKLFKDYYSLVSCYEALEHGFEVTAYTQKYIENAITKKIKDLKAKIATTFNIYDSYVNHILFKGVDDRGNSSDILRYIAYGNAGYLPSSPKTAIPYDIADFGRCYRFVKLQNFEGLLIKTNAVTSVFPMWKPYIENWSKLADLYEKVLFEDLEFNEFRDFIRSLREPDFKI